MQPKEDLRIKKTKRKLYDTFLLLLGDKLYDDITVNELCLKADVRRATFYKHFSDKTAFVAYAIHRLREDFDEEVWGNDSAGYTAEYYTAYATYIVDYLDSHSAAVSNTFTTPSVGDVFNLVVSINQSDTHERLIESTALGLHLASTPEIVASMLIGGTCSILYSWLRDDKTLPKDELIQDLCSCICAVFK